MHLLIFIPFIYFFFTPNPSFAQVSNCEPGSKNIDASLCPDYSNYANNPAANSTVFFNNIVFTRSFKNHRDTPLPNNQNVVITIPAATFYFKQDPQNPSSYITLEGSGCQMAPCSRFKNYVIQGTRTSQTSTTFVANDPADSNLVYNHFFGLNQGDGFTLKNIDFRNNNLVGFNPSAIRLANVKGHILIDNISCSGVKKKGKTCLKIDSNLTAYPGFIPSVEVKNSIFKDYNTGIAIGPAVQVNIHQNTLDNSQPDTTVDGGNVDLTLYNINSAADSSFPSYVDSNLITQGPNSPTNGETAIGLIGNSNYINVTNNQIKYTRDTGIWISSHNPNDENDGNPTDCIFGGPKNVTVTNNIFVDIMLASINVENLPAPNSVGTSTSCPDATIRNILIDSNQVITHPENTHFSGGSFSFSASPKGPIYNLKVVNNSIQGTGTINPANDPYQNRPGSCLSLKGLQGENNNSGDIIFENNRFFNCKIGTILNWSYWPRYPRPPANTLDNSNSRPNRYLTIKSNIYNHSDTSFQDILYTQNPTLLGVDLATVYIQNNYFIGPGRCNSSCSNTSQCAAPQNFENTRNLPQTIYPYQCQNGFCTNNQCPSTPPPPLSPTQPPPFVCPPNTPPHQNGNANCDNFLNLDDYIIWKSNRLQYLVNPAPPGSSPWLSDFNLDQKVDLNDYIVWKSNRLRSLN